MAHFAQLDENNVVTQVIVIGNDQLKTTITTEINGMLMIQVVESEAAGIEFCKTLYGADTSWKQTSYNGNFRGKYAGIGDTFDGTNFVAPEQPVAVEAAPVLETSQIQSLVTDQIQAFCTEQISALGA